MSDKSKVNRIILQGGLPLAASPPNHEFGIEAPAGYRIVSAYGSPDEDGTYDVPFSIILDKAEGSAVVNRALFRVHADTALGNYTYTVVCERSDEPDLVIAGTVITF